MQSDIKKPIKLGQGGRRLVGLDQVYNNVNNEDLRKINKPITKKFNELLVKRVVLVVALMIVLLIAYSAFFNNGKDAEERSSWYAIKLVDGKIYYGQVLDLSADPVEVDNVYYDYDQIKGDPSAGSGQEKSETENIRLVKRGKETHGPTGTMYFVRSQIVQFEELADNSKVLQAIMANE